MPATLPLVTAYVALPLVRMSGSELLIEADARRRRVGGDTPRGLKPRSFLHSCVRGALSRWA